MSRITHITLPRPDTSLRRNRSLAAVMNSQNHRMKTKMANASARKLAKVDSAENGIYSLPQTIAARRRTSIHKRSLHCARSGDLAERERSHAGDSVEANAASDVAAQRADIDAAAAGGLRGAGRRRLMRAARRQGQTQCRGGGQDCTHGFSVDVVRAR